jgi:mRNA-degrading endonuclease RelE of RelBE toxin-antitoxin system
MEFIETSVFSSLVEECLSAEEYLSLQIALTLRPEQGSLIPHSGGLRKIRWSYQRRGRRGGLRVIYYWYPTADRIYLLFLYPKNRLEDLTAGQIKLLRKIVEEDLS